MQFLETFGLLKRSLTGLIDASYGTVGLGSTQARLLRCIGDGEHLSQADLARATRTDPALTGRALQTLIDRGWVQRRRSREDRRAFSLALTESGEALLRSVLSVRDDVARRVVSHLSEDDLAAFERIARKLAEAFPERPRDHQAEAPARSGRKSRA